MIRELGIYFKDTPENIHEIINAGDSLKEECPVFYYRGNPFLCQDFGVRELTEEEIIDLVLPKKKKVTTDRKLSEYEMWLELNDHNEHLGNEYFFVKGKKFYTVDREEFKTLLEEEKSRGKFSFEYRGNTFSVYHFC